MAVVRLLSAVFRLLFLLFFFWNRSLLFLLVLDMSEAIKCNVRGCKVRGAQLMDCAGPECSRKVHLLCYQGVVLGSGSGNKIPYLPDNLVCCTKVCYNAIVKSRQNGQDSSRGKWDSDGKRGPKDPNTSMRILLDWITTEGNYSRFCGKNNNGVTKMQFASILADKMKAETASADRNAKQVLDKIKRIEEALVWCTVRIIYI